MAVKLNPVSVIEARLGIDNNGRVQKYFTQQCKNYMNDFVPKDEGNLRKIVTLTSDSITYESPYAHAQYIGIVNGSPVQNYTTPGTGPYWDERMKTAYMDEIAQKVQNYIGGHND